MARSTPNETLQPAAAEMSVSRSEYLSEALTMRLPVELRTERLLLRRWRPADQAPFAALNADPRVMKYFPALLSREESDARVARIEAHFD